MKLRPRDVEVWSYLIGLGPVGDTVRCTVEMVRSDLNIRTHSHFALIISRLIAAKVVRRECDYVFTVLRRIGDEGRPAQRQPRFMRGVKHFEPREWGAKRIERLARLNEIPADNRGLTERTFGDPIPGDPRRPWQGDARAHA